MWGSSGPWLATALLGLALVLGTGTPSSAASQTVSSGAQAPVLSLSLDGQHWTATLDQPLFVGDRRWVPGDSETVSVWMRNLTMTEAALDLRLEPIDASWTAADLVLSARVDGRPVEPGQGSTDGRLDPMTGPVRVDLTVTMARRAHDRAQQRRAPFSLQLALRRLHDADAGSAPISSAVLPGLSEPVAGRLPGTGTPPFGVPLTLVGLAAAARAAIVAHRTHQARKVISCPHP